MKGGRRTIRGVKCLEKGIIRLWNYETRRWRQRGERVNRREGERESGREGGRAGWREQGEKA